MQPVDGVSALPHRVDDRGAVLLVSREQRGLDLGLRDGRVHALAVVLDRHDVRVLVGEEGQELGQLARAVGDPRADDEVAPRQRAGRGA